MKKYRNSFLVSSSAILEVSTIYYEVFFIFFFKYACDFVSNFSNIEVLR
jgi:hypothetical protein